MQFLAVLTMQRYRSPSHGCCICGLFVAATSLVAGHALAVVVTINDTTPGTATNDGSINVGEYVGSSSGINSGFGNVIGSNSTLHVDSSSSGGLNFGLVSGGGDLKDIVVIYIDSIAGGFSDTTTLNDQQDGGRRAISGNSSSGQSEITFAPGFQADYAITIEAGFSGLFQLVAGGNNSLGFVRGNNLTPSGNAGAGAWELDLTLSDIGLAPGDSFDYVATYISESAFRSNEFHGVASFTGANPGFNDVTLSAGDFNTFVSVPEASVVLFGGLVCGVIGLVQGRKWLRARRGGLESTC